MIEEKTYKWLGSVRKGAFEFFWSAVAFYGVLLATNPDLLAKIGAKSVWASVALAALAAAWNWKKNHNK